MLEIQPHNCLRLFQSDVFFEGRKLIAILIVSSSGTVGVAAVTAGPGLTNTVTAVKNAQMAESPLLLMGGAAGTLLQVEWTHVPLYTVDRRQ